MRKLTIFEKSIFWFTQKQYAVVYGFGADNVEVITSKKEIYKIKASSDYTTKSIDIYCETATLIASDNPQNGRILSVEEIIHAITPILKNQYAFEHINLKYADSC